jgi:PAS domain S-box-containing protein
MTSVDAAADPRALEAGGLKPRLWQAAIAAGVLLAALDCTPLTAGGHVAIKLIGSFTGIGGIALGLRLFQPAHRRLWRVFGVFATLWAAGWVVAAPSLVAHGAYPASPSAADALWIASYVAVAAGLAAMLIRRERAYAVLIDVAAIVASLGVMSGIFLIAPYLAASHLPAGERLTHVVYAAVDIVNFALMVRLLLSPRARNRAALLVAFATLGLLGSDVVWNWLTLAGTYVAGSWADVGWVAAPLFLAAAALHPSMRQLSDERPERAVRLRVSSAVLLGLAALCGGTFHPLFEGSTAGADSTAALIALTFVGIFVAALIAVRVASLVRHSQGLAVRLSEALEERGRLLEQSQARYKMLVEQLPAVVFRLGQEHPGEPLVPLYVSPQARSIVGVDPVEWVAQPEAFWQRVHENDREMVDATRTRLAAGLATQPFEFRVLKPDGSPVWLRSEQTLIDDAEGLYAQGILLDVTPRKQAEAERDRMELDLRLGQKLESVGQLAAGIAHEINTPIQFVGDTVTFLDDSFAALTVLLAEYGRLHEAARLGAVNGTVLRDVAAAEDEADLDYLTERVSQAFERAFDGIGRVAGIVGAMRSFAHPPTSQKVPVDINAALCNTLVVAANEYKYYADVETGFGDLPLVVCDAGDMNQVFLNLLVNAAHAVQDAVGDSGRRGTIAISTRIEGSDAVVTVRDTGLGIAPDVVNRVFEPFFTTKEIGRGTGQGLALVRSIVADKHEGRVTLETTVGEGTTFEVHLPIRPDASGEELAA